MKEKVVVGMSGGVDSSVAAYLLKKQGYDVIGVTMQIWQEEDEFVQEENGGCCGLSAVDDARRVAQMIGIPHYVMNFRKDFKDKVIDYFCEEYLNARTPNPCIACNRYVKWESLLKRCLDIGADYIATGHYSQITKLDNGRYALKCSKTQKKDQTYALYNLTQNQLSKTLMPIGAYTKDEVRQIAEEIGLLVANKPDSQDICFIPDGDYAGFIDRCVGEASPTGPFLDEAGRVLGQHKGFVRYTKGQHKGLGLAIEPPLYVTKKDSATHAIYVGPSGALFTTELTAGEWNGIALAELTAPVTVSVKTRYSQREAEATAEPLLGGRFRLRFREPQRAVTPGQFAVLYDGEDVVGSGVILE